jgi:hypothetical protein
MSSARKLPPFREANPKGRATPEKRENQNRFRALSVIHTPEVDRSLSSRLREEA